MEINADFAKRVVVHSGELEWQASPMKGVHRRMLDRLGDEVARATTIVRYDPKSRFSPHVHTGGEEFVVLKGVFQDEHGDFPAGSYIRNPPQSRHTPGSETGCVIFVKLWQFDLEDRTHVRLQYDKMERIEDPRRHGVRLTPLFSDERETVQIEEWAPGAEQSVDMPNGAEILVLEGSLVSEGETLAQHSWLRLPQGSRLEATAGEHGVKIWLKRDHLRFTEAPAA